jgi:hypothetical protein
MGKEELMGIPGESPPVVVAEQPTTLETLKEPPRYAKAIMAAALAGVGGAAVASFDGFTTPEVWSVVASTVAAFVGVYGVQNKPG